MVCFIHQQLGAKAPLTRDRSTHIDSICDDIWTALTDLKFNAQQRIRHLNKIEKSLPNKRDNKDKTPTAASYHASSDDPEQWTDAIE